MVLTLLQVVSAVPSSGAATNTKYLFVFGDSYTSSEFSLSGTKPSAFNPMGNPAQDAYPYKPWLEVLTTQLNTSLILTYNLASDDAPTDTTILPITLPSFILSFVDQANLWTANLQPHPTYAPWTSDNSLFAVWFGVNDVGDSYSQAGEDAWINKHLDKYFFVLGSL